MFTPTIPPMFIIEYEPFTNRMRTNFNNQTSDWTVEEKTDQWGGHFFRFSINHDFLNQLKPNSYLQKSGFNASKTSDIYKNSLKNF